MSQAPDKRKRGGKLLAWSFAVMMRYAVRRQDDAAYQRVRVVYEPLIRAAGLSEATSKLLDNWQVWCFNRLAH